MTRRRAISLAELLAALTACSVILTVSASLLHRAMHIQSDARTYIDGERSVLRLSDQFRRDVHQANEAITGDDGAGPDVVLRLRFASGETIDYSNEPGLLRRTVSRAGETISREEFAYSASCRIEVRQAESPGRVLLTVSPPEGADPRQTARPPFAIRSSPVSFQLEAVLSRDGRFAGSTPQQEPAQ
jgi:hypothetical protein